MLKVNIDKNVISVFPVIAHHTVAIKSMLHFKLFTTREKGEHHSIDHTFMPDNHWHITFDKQVDRELILIFAKIYGIPSELAEKITDEFLNAANDQGEVKYIHRFRINREILHCSKEVHHNEEGQPHDSFFPPVVGQASL